MLLIFNSLEMEKKLKLRDLSSLLIGENFKKGKDMGKVLCFILMVEYIKETGLGIKEMAKGSKNLQIALFIKETMSTANLKDMEDTNGKMDKFTKVNGKMVKNMDLEYGEVQRETLTSENGKKEKQKVMVYIPGQMKIDMKDNLKIV